MEKKNFNKKGKVGSNRSKRLMNKEGKRFNKSTDSISLFKDGSKILKEAKQGKRSEKQDNIPQRTTPRKEKVQLSVFQFPGTPNKTYYATLIKNSQQRYGYEVINRGRCVKVEEFDMNAWVRVTASDGRVGITLQSNIKSMF